MPESTQHKLDRVRRPRVQITYDVETGGAMRMVELPFVVGVLADLSGQPKEALKPLKDRKFTPIDRDNLIWQDFGVAAPGQFLDATQHTEIHFDGPSSSPPVEDSRWGASSAQVAHLLFQLPARAAFLGRRMVAGEPR